jgi:hypothetical protein
MAAIEVLATKTPNVPVAARLTERLTQEEWDAALAAGKFAWHEKGDGFEVLHFHRSMFIACTEATVYFHIGLRDPQQSEEPTEESPAVG